MLSELSVRKHVLLGPLTGVDQRRQHGSVLLHAARQGLNTLRLGPLASWPTGSHKLAQPSPATTARTLVVLWMYSLMPP